jgi:glucuronokinase
MIIETTSYPRAALIGNPSDGYFGKTIAFVFNNFQAKVHLYETPQLEIKPEKLDLPVYESIEDLVEGIKLNGYYGGVRLLKATIKTFYRYCMNNNITLSKKNFTICYNSNIPLRLGLAGSSAIITAGMKALMKFYHIDIEPPVLANLVLSTETDQLGISAGLQDRVAQAYEHPVFMNFDKEIMQKQGFGLYTPLDFNKLPPIYIAYRKDQSQGSEVIHNNLKARFEIGEKVVHDAMREWAGLAEQFLLAMNNNDNVEIHSLINRNYDLRESLIPISDENKMMVRLARSVGASAKFTGSGGAIIGTYSTENQYREMEKLLSDNQIDIIKPGIVTQNKHS